MIQHFHINTAEIKKMVARPLPKRQRSYHEILWLTNGMADFIIDGDRFKVEADAFFIFPKDRIHQFLPNENVEGQVIRFCEDTLDNFPRLLFSKFNHISEVKIDETEHHQFQLFFQLFSTELKNHSDKSPIVVNLLKSIIYKLHDIKQQQLPCKKTPLFDVDVFDRLQILMDQHITEHRPISFYADKLNITPRKLGETIKSVMQKSTTYVMAERLLTEAKRKLAYSDATITEIAYDLGFEDNSYFTKFFKKQAGMTPKVFRGSFGSAK